MGLNSNYIMHGVLRFIRHEHGYSKGDRSAAMVGYIQSMRFEDILSEVNAVANSIPITTITASATGWQVRGISSLHQVLLRPFPVSPFTLQHLWIDLRHKYATKRAMPSGDQETRDDLEENVVVHMMDKTEPSVSDLPDESFRTSKLREPRT